MSKAVLISIQPKWCEMIANGVKTLELRKSKPKLEPPFKCYIYCTKDPKLQFWTGPRYSYADDHSHNAFDRCGNGKVIGEFVCDAIFAVEQNWEIHDELPGSPEETWYEWNDAPDGFEDTEAIEKASCLSFNEIKNYIGAFGYFWHISDLVIYDMPKILSEFAKPGKCPYNPSADGKCTYKYHCFRAGKLERCGEFMERPPQSWCYVEELPRGADHGTA